MEVKREVAGVVRGKEVVVRVGGAVVVVEATVLSKVEYVVTGVIIGGGREVGRAKRNPVKIVGQMAWNMMRKLAWTVT